MSERLEEIRKDKALSNDDAVIKNSHYEWLVEQAEQMDEMKDVIRHNFKNHKHHQEINFRLEQQNNRYRNLLESLSDTHDIAEEIIKESPSKNYVTQNDLLQYILRKINDELEESE